MRSNELGLDFDREKYFRFFQKERYPKIKHLVKKMVILATRPGHYHVYIVLRRHHRFVNLSALQRFCGSDIKRELSNMSRIIAGASKPILLIEFTRVQHFRRPDITCSCPPKLHGRKFGNCPHLVKARGHRARFGYLSTRLRIVGVDPL